MGRGATLFCAFWLLFLCSEINIERRTLNNNNSETFHASKETAYRFRIQMFGANKRGKIRVFLFLFTNFQRFRYSMHNYKIKYFYYYQPIVFMLKYVFLFICICVFIEEISESFWWKTLYQNPRDKLPFLRIFSAMFFYNWNW